MNFEKALEYLVKANEAGSFSSLYDIIKINIRLDPSYNALPIFSKMKDCCDNLSEHKVNLELGLYLLIMKNDLDNAIDVLMSTYEEYPGRKEFEEIKPLCIQFLPKVISSYELLYHELSAKASTDLHREVLKMLVEMRPELKSIEPNKGFMAKLIWENAVAISRIEELRNVWNKKSELRGPMQYIAQNEHWSYINPLDYPTQTERLPTIRNWDRNPNFKSEDGRVIKPGIGRPFQNSAGRGRPFQNSAERGSPFQNSAERGRPFQNSARRDRPFRNSNNSPRRDQSFQNSNNKPRRDNLFRNSYSSPGRDRPFQNRDRPSQNDSEPKKLWGNDERGYYQDREARSCKPKSDKGNQDFRYEPNNRTPWINRASEDTKARSSGNIEDKNQEKKEENRDKVQVEKSGQRARGKIKDKKQEKKEEDRVKVPHELIKSTKKNENETEESSDSDDNGPQKNTFRGNKRIPWCKIQDRDSNKEKVPKPTEIQKNTNEDENTNSSSDESPLEKTFKGNTRKPFCFQNTDKGRDKKAEKSIKTKVDENSEDNSDGNGTKNEDSEYNIDYDSDVKSPKNEDSEYNSDYDSDVKSPKNEAFKGNTRKPWCRVQDRDESSSKPIRPEGKSNESNEGRILGQVKNLNFWKKEFETWNRNKS